MIIGALGIIVFFGFIMAIILYSVTPQINAHMTEVHGSREAVERFDQKLNTFKEQIKAAVTDKQKKDITLTLSEEEINSKIDFLIAEGELPMKELNLNLKEEACWIYSVFNNPGINAKIGIISKLRVEKSNIKVTVMDFSLGRLPLPSSIKEWMGNLLDITLKLQDPVGDLPIELTAIQIGDGKFIVKGMTKVGK